MNEIITHEQELFIRFAMMGHGFAQIGEALTTARWEDGQANGVLLVDHTDIDHLVKTQLRFHYDAEKGDLWLKSLTAQMMLQVDLPAKYAYAEYKVNRKSRDAQMPSLSRIIDRLYKNIGLQDRRASIANDKDLQEKFRDLGFEDWQDMLKRAVHQQGMTILQTHRSAGLPDHYGKANVEFEFIVVRPSYKDSPFITSMTAELSVEGEGAQTMREFTRHQVLHPSPMPTKEEMMQRVLAGIKQDINLVERVRQAFAVPATGKRQGTKSNRPGRPRPRQS